LHYIHKNCGVCIGGETMIFNQPFDGQLGDLLISKMEQPFNKLTILSAFAKNSGVLRLKPALERFRARGNRIDAFIGVDSYGTSYEALLNLYHLCDSLYVIHSENPTTTFHSKIYALSNDDRIWIAVGSNNLTAGGLWTNFESCDCTEVTIADAMAQGLLTPFTDLLSQYENDDYDCSIKIVSEDLLTELLESDYIRREARIQLETTRGTRRPNGDNAHAPLFGIHRGIRAPRVAREPRGAVVRTANDRQAVQATHAIIETDLVERIWFETKAMTGGSRNILDLSKLGRIVNGSGSDSRYETTNPQFILGGVAFFDLGPEHEGIEKDVTINYNGVDYSPCTIKFAPNNGSWRIQLKGENQDGTNKLHTVGGHEWLVHKILVFEKIRTDYYVLSVVDETEIEQYKNQSYVVARNGLGISSKLYGLL
jgi:hypothetical protein